MTREVQAPESCKVYFPGFRASNVESLLAFYIIYLIQLPRFKTIVFKAVVKYPYSYHLIPSTTAPLHSSLVLNEDIFTDGISPDDIYITWIYMYNLLFVT
jgi:hypothetical protein